MSAYPVPAWRIMPSQSYDPEPKTVVERFMVWLLQTPSHLPFLRVAALVGRLAMWAEMPAWWRRNEKRATKWIRGKLGV